MKQKAKTANPDSSDVGTTIFFFYTKQNWNNNSTIQKSCWLIHCFCCCTLGAQSSISIVAPSPFSAWCISESSKYPKQIPAPKSRCQANALTCTKNEREEGSALLQRQVVSSAANHPATFLTPTSKGLCTSSDRSGVSGSLKHCHRDRGPPFQTLGLFCSANNHVEILPGNGSGIVKYLYLFCWSPVSEMKLRIHTFKKKNAAS